MERKHNLGRNIQQILKYSLELRNQTVQKAAFFKTKLIVKDRLKLNPSSKSKQIFTKTTKFHASTIKSGGKKHQNYPRFERRGAQNPLTEATFELN